MGFFDLIQRSTGHLVAGIQRLAKAGGDLVPPGWILHDTTYASVTGTLELPSTPEEFYKEYRQSIWAYCAISAKARAAAGVPILLKRQRKGTDDIVREHEILTLLEKPSEKRTWFQLVESIVTNLEIAGNAFLEKNREGKKKKQPVAELLSMFPPRVKIIVDPKLGIVRYDYKPNLQTFPLKPQDVLHFLYIDPVRDERGIGPMVPAWLSSRMDVASQKYNNAFFERGGIPGVVLETEQQVPPAERLRIKEEWVAAYGGVSNAQQVAVLPFGLKLLELGSTHRDMQFDKLRQMTREEILAAFRVPPVLVGLLGGSTYANAYVQLEVFRDQVLVPLLRGILAVFTNSLLEEYPDGKDLYLDVDIAKMKFPDETDKEFGRALNSWNAGITTLDETRAMLQMSPLTPAQRKELEEKGQAKQPEQPGQPFPPQAKNGNGKKETEEPTEEEGQDEDEVVLERTKEKRSRRLKR